MKRLEWCCDPEDTELYSSSFPRVHAITDEGLPRGEQVAQALNTLTPAHADTLERVLNFGLTPVEPGGTVRLRELLGIIRTITGDS